MSKTSRTILFFGNERLATGVTTTTPVLRSLLRAGYTVTAIIVAQDETGPSRKSRELEISSVADEYKIPILQPQKLSDAKDQLSTYGAEAAVLVAYGKLVPATIIDLFPHGIINIHPSLLPKHRGSIPLEGVLLGGDKETGVSLMQLAVKMDAGPIYAQETILLRGNETKQGLADQLSTLASAMLIDYLPSILDGSLVPGPQKEADATYDTRITKTAGLLNTLDWNQPVETIYRKVRAYAGWPRTRTTVGDTDIIITRAHIGSGDGIPGSLWIDGKMFGIHARDGVLIIDSLIPAGKREMTGQAFLAGYNPLSED
jgi:methionyl-tRNA formyltransferase